MIAIISSPPGVELRMPISTEPHVDLTCALPMQGFVTSLGYNLLLVTICTYYAFKTRTLPDNFNESRYIALCVYSTLIIWLAFLPSYFTNNHAFYQIILLSCALSLNATVILVFLFVSKIYGIFKGGSQQSPEQGVFKYTVRRPMPPCRDEPVISLNDNTEMTDLTTVQTNGAASNDTASISQ